MDIIQLLPDSVANQIAAGEVIQRPASVIKELVENAIDAGATDISILVTDAGKASIQVIDNGKGMSDTDARLSFERHATSKIREANDLFALSTMGFRGEALASIAAVAQVTLQTRTAEEEIGTRIVIAGSRVVEQEPVSCPVGSNFLVENLFYNIPARRKFLKTNSTEMNNIMQAFERIVLVYPEISFSLYSNGTEVKALRKGNVHQRIIDVFGKRINQELLPVSAETSICNISGFVGKPESAKKKGAQQFFFVNGRYMKHPYFHKAVMSAYDRLVPNGEQVSYFVYLKVDPQDIDVNIHPVKTEIKFDNERDIWQILMAAVRDAVGKFSDITTLDFDTAGKPDIPVFNPVGGNVEAPHIDFNPRYNPFDNTVSTVPSLEKTGNTVTRRSAVGRRGDVFMPQGYGNSAKGWEELFGDGQRSGGAGSDGVLYNNDDSGQSLFPSRLSWNDDGEPEGDDDTFAAERSTEHYQLRGMYIATQLASGLMLTDQNRASQRILFEKYMKSLETRTAHVQKVLFPEVVQFPPSYIPAIGEILDELQALGFEITDLGGGSYSISGVPAGVAGLDTVRLVNELVAEAVEADTMATERLHHVLAAALARKAATPYGEILSNDDMEAMLKQLLACQTQKYTADGKPVISVLTYEELAKRFA